MTREELLAVCDDQNCNGEWHDCYNCCGEGYVESDDPQDDEDEVCPICHGMCGWPCPVAEDERQEARR